MKLFYSALVIPFKKEELPPIGVLHSYALIKSVEIPEYADQFFLDSGAFTAHRQGKPVDLGKYIQFVHENLAKLTIYASLDMIGNPEVTFANYKTMVAEGLSPLPTVHHGSDLRWIEKYLEMGCPLIGLGGMAMMRVQKRRQWLAEVFSKYPTAPFHGFGLLDGSLMLEFPFTTVDGTGLLRTATCGALRLPGVKNYMIGEACSSSRSEARWFTSEVQEVLEEWCSSRKIDFALCRKSTTAGSKERLRLMIVAHEEFAVNREPFALTGGTPSKHPARKTFLL